MTKNTILGLLLLALLGCSSQAVNDTISSMRDTDTTIVWRGFRHHWDHAVHRAGVIGNWVEMPESTDLPRSYSIKHDAQSGSEKDIANLGFEYSVLSASNTQFGIKTHSIDMELRHGELKIFSQPSFVDQNNDGVDDGNGRQSCHPLAIDISEFESFADKDKYETVINGFKLERKSTEKSRKLGRLRVAVNRPTRVGNKLESCINLMAMMSCKSTECLDGGNRNPIKYTLKLTLLYIAYKDGAANFVTHAAIPTRYPYDSRFDGVTPRQVPENLGNINTPIHPAANPLANTEYAVNALGIKSFDFNVSKEVNLGKPDKVPHLFKWKMWLAYSGDLRRAPNLVGQNFFSHSANGITNHGHSGNVNNEIQAVTMQFKNGSIANCKYDGKKEFSKQSAGASEPFVRNGLISHFGDGTCIADSPRPLPF